MQNFSFLDLLLLMWRLIALLLGWNGCFNTKIHNEACRSTRKGSLHSCGGRISDSWEVFTDHGEGRFSVFIGVWGADCQEEAILDVELRAMDGPFCFDLYFGEGPRVNSEGVEGDQCEDEKGSGSGCGSR